LFVLDHEYVKEFASNKDDQNIGSLPDNLEVAPAAIPKTSQHAAKDEFLAEELSKVRSKDWSAFLDALSNSVVSGNLLERPLTIADMRHYAKRTYRSHLDNYGD
jgi:hypothetical protein